MSEIKGAERGEEGSRVERGNQARAGVYGWMAPPNLEGSAGRPHHLPDHMAGGGEARKDKI